MDMLKDRRLPCRHCGYYGIPETGPGSGSHWKSALCARCGRFLQRLSPRPPAERAERAAHFRRQAMANKPPTDKQLRWLAYHGVRDVPANRQQAIADNSMIPKGF
jgi:hypothetical protein